MSLGKCPSHQRLARKHVPFVDLKTHPFIWESLRLPHLISGKNHPPIVFRYFSPAYPSLEEIHRSQPLCYGQDRTPLCYPLVN